MSLNNDSTIPSPLGPADTMPSQLGPAEGLSRRPPVQPGRGLPWYLWAGLLAVAAYVLLQAVGV